MNSFGSPLEIVGVGHDVQNGRRAQNRHEGRNLTAERRREGVMRKSSWVLVDSGWAKQLGVTRTAGVYRIARGELVRRLQGMPGICASIEEQHFNVGGTAHWRVEEKLVA